MVVAMVVIFIAVFFVIDYPLFRVPQRKKQELEKGTDTKTRILEEKESTYEVIRELEMDYRTGKLSKTDYEELYRKYRAEALESIRVLEELPAESERPLESEVEEEIKKRRRALHGNTEILPGNAETACPGCGERNESGRTSCKVCGEKLVSKCTACNTLNSPDSQYCRN